MTNKTTSALKLSTVALKDIACTSQTDDLLWWQIRAREALAAIREVLAESKPAPDGRIPKTVFTLDDISKAAEMGRQAGMIDALAEPANTRSTSEYSEPVKQEPVAVISESAIGLVKLHSNGACLPFGTQLYAAPVSAEREWAELTDDEMWDVFISKDWTGEPLHLMGAAISAYKEKNK